MSTKSSSLFTLVLILPLLLMQPASGQVPGQEAAAVTTAVPSLAPEPAQVPAAQQQLRVRIGKSLLIHSQQPLERVSVSNPTVTSAVIISPEEVLVHGLEPGEATLILWDAQGRSQTYDLRIEMDLPGLRAALGQLFPDQSIQVAQSGSALVLSGSVTSPQAVDRVVLLAKTYSPNVVSLMQLPPRQSNRAVLLQVRFAEVDRTAIQELGLNILSTGLGNTIGSISTQQFSSPTVSTGAIPGDVRPGQTPPANNLLTGAIGNLLGHTPTVFGLSDLLNIFLFRPDANLGITLRALQQKNLLQILAEPNLLALDGTEASFLAGGEFPFPVVQGGGNFTAVTIQFREFGVRLKFTPTLQDDGTVRLKVAPEVSSLDFSNALTISGFIVPALSTRKAETEVALRDGQSFAIAGLIDNRLIEVASKIPGLGDIPFFGKLFRSRSQNRSNTELLVLVTPKLVNPLENQEAPPLPAFPKPFLDEKEFGSKFQGQMGETPPQTKKP